MKRILIYTMIGAVTFAAAGGSTMFLLNKKAKEKTNIKAPVEEDFEDEDEGLEEEPPTNQELFMSSIIDNNLNVKNLDVVVYNLEPGEDLALNFKGAFDYKGMELATSNFSEFKIQGDLNAKYKHIDETLNLTFLPGKYDAIGGQNGLTNGKLFFGYADHHYSMNANTIPEILDVLKVFNIPVDNVKDEVKVSKQPAKKIDPLAILGTMTETETPTGFDYTVTLPEEMGKIVLESGKDNELSGIRTEGNLKFGEMQIKVDADVETGDSTFVKYPGNAQSIDNITGIFQTVANLYASKQLSAKYNIKFSDASGKIAEPIVLNGDLGIDLSDSTNSLESLNKTDLIGGKYYISVTPLANSINTRNTIKGLYSGNDIYLKVNELLKAKIDEAFVGDLTKFINEFNKEIPDLSGALDQVNNLIVGTEVEDLLKGNFLAIKDIVKDIIISDTKYEFVFNPASFGLNGEELRIILNLKQGLLKSLRIEGLSFKNYSLDFDLDLQDFVDFTKNIPDPENYVSYSGAFNIYNSISNVINSKKLDTTYDISLIDTTTNDQYNFLGDIKANLNNVDLNNAATLADGEYELNLATNYAGLDRNIKAINKNNNVYFKYNDLITNRAKHTTINDMFNTIDKLITNQNSDESAKPSDIFKQINFSLSDIQAMLDPIISELKAGNIDILANYANLSVEEVRDESNNLTNKYFDIRLYPNGDALGGESRLVIHAILDSVTNKLAKISVNNLNFDKYLLNFDLEASLLPKDIILDETQYAPIDNLFYGVTKLMADKAFKTTLDASVVTTTTPEVNPITLSAVANVDLNTQEVYGKLDITGITVDNKREITHRVYLDYDELENNLDSELLARYCNVQDGHESSGMFINMNESKIISLIDRIQNMPDDNVLRRLLNIVKQAQVVLPIETIVKNKDYLQLFDKYLKGLTFSVTESDLGPQYDEINIIVDKALLGLGTNLDVTLTASYETQSITKVVIKDLQINDKTVNLTANLEDYDTENLGKERLRVTHPKDKNTYFDFNNLDLLFELGINTTNTNVYHLNGTLDLSITDGATKQYNPNYEVDIRVEVQDNAKVKAYILVYYHTFNEWNEAQFSILENDDVVINYRYKMAGIKKWHNVMKITNSEFKKNFCYYVFYATLSLPQLAITGIDDGLEKSGASSATPDTALKIQYDQIFTKMENQSNNGNKSGKFLSTIDLSKIADPGITLGKVDLNLIYDTNEQGIKGLSKLEIHSDCIAKVFLWSIVVDLKLDNLAVTEPIDQFFKIRNDNISYWNRKIGENKYTTAVRERAGHYHLEGSSAVNYDSWDLSQL